MDAKLKSLGQLVDELTVTNLKIWFKIETVSTSTNDTEVANACRSLHSLNARRNALINAIDELVPVGAFSTSEKTYK